jgi:hypothetical protein
MTRIGAITSFHRELSAGQEPYWRDGWGSAEGQRVRFEALVRSSRYQGGSVVDFGCGTGALRDFLASLDPPFTYLGLDMNGDLLPAGDEFRVIAPDAVDFPVADYVFASGIFQFADPDDPLYYRRLAEALYQRCRVALAVTFLSALRDRSARDPDELYLTPGEAADLASSLSGTWVLDHSYHPDRGDLTIAVHR